MNHRLTIRIHSVHQIDSALGPRSHLWISAFPGPPDKVMSIYVNLRKCMYQKVVFTSTHKNVFLQKEQRCDESAYKLHDTVHYNFAVAYRHNQLLRTAVTLETGSSNIHQWLEYISQIGFPRILYINV